MRLFTSGSNRSSGIWRFAVVFIAIAMLMVPASLAQARSVHGHESSPIAAGKKGKTHPSKAAKGSPPSFWKGGTFYQHPPSKIVERKQGGRLHLRTGTFRLRKKNLPWKVEGQIGKGITVHGHARRAANINLYVNTGNLPSSLTPPEPSVAQSGNVAVYTANQFICVSVSSGSSFNCFTPQSLYSDSPDGGADGDMVVQYIPQIDRFALIDQYWGNLGGIFGRNRYRLMIFPPAAVTATGINYWTSWDITAASFPALTDIFLDFPDLAVGQNYLYLSANDGHNGGVNQSVIARIGLYNLQNSLNLADNSHGEAWRYIRGGLFFGRVVQNTGTTAWWGQNNTTSSLQVSYWDESSTSWHGPITVNDYTWPNTGYTSRTPDTQAWISTYTGTILAGTRTGSNNLWLAWTAGTGSGRLAWLSQPHIELVDINTSNQHLISQRAIWNPGFAFAFPYLNTSQAGDLGISLGWGGNGVDWTNSAVGDLTRSPFLVWNVTSSNTSCGCGRWGDYLSIRPAYGAIGQGDTNAFVASGFGTNTNPQTQTGAFFDNHYVQFSVS